MLDQKGNAKTTTWQDNHSGRRRHKLMTKELGDTIPAIGANENVEDHDDVLAPAKLFSPYSNWTWYVTEWDAETGLCFGLVKGFEHWRKSTASSSLALRAVPVDAGAAGQHSQA